MNNFNIVSNKQLAVSCVLISVIVFSLITINSFIINYSRLPVVHLAGDKCVIVINMQNGDDFSCDDIGTTLKQYRTKSYEK